MFGVTCSKKKKKKGKVITIFFSLFVIFFSIQRAYVTLKKNLVKFQYTEVIN